MTNELKSLTWKYFWQQKMKEIMITLLIIAGIIFIPYLVGVLFQDNIIILMGEDPLESEIPYWAGGFIILIITIIPLSLLWFGISEWLKSNWKKASLRASEELQKDDELDELYKEILL